MAGIREILRRIPEEAWGQWYREWYFYALRLTRNDADAKDAVSEAFRRTIERDPSLSSDRHARNYVRRAIKNVVAGFREKRSTQKRLLEEFGRSHPGTVPAPLNALIRADQLAHIIGIVRMALAEMDDELREALELYYDPENKTTFRDVAEAQGVAVGTAHKRVQDALDLIAKAIEGDLG